MGADIHMFIEYKVGDGPWVADSNHQPYEEDDNTYLNSVNSSGRDYELFAILASVRGPGPEPKGFPDDVSAIIKAESDRWDGDGHSHSFSSLKDFMKALTKAGYDLNAPAEPAAFSSDYNHGYENLVAYCLDKVTKMKLDLEAEKTLLGQRINTEVKCRLVYFFDN